MWIANFLLLAFCIHQAFNEHPSKSRSKRYLIFTSATQYGAFVTVSIPLHPETTVSVAWFFEANYFTVDNATYFEPLLGDIVLSNVCEYDVVGGAAPGETAAEGVFMCRRPGDSPPFGHNHILSISRSKDKRSTDSRTEGITRRNIYLFIENMLEKHGYEGQACLLRAICENSNRHFLHNGVIGDILHLVLTPSTSMSEDHLDDSYYEAEYRGLEDQCDLYEEDCPSSPLEFISLHIEEVF